MKKISLSNLTEYQKSLLTRLAYVNLDSRRFHNFKEKQWPITISDLKILLLKQNEPYLGCLHSLRLKKMVSNVTTTNSELITELISAGLGDLEVVDFVDNKETGFNAICLKDSVQDVGFSFRGTDLKTFSSLIADGFTDVEAFLTNNTEQISQAQALFEQHQNPNGKNFLYGHSLGGFLAESIYLQNYENVENAFVINPLHISSQVIDSQAKINAFRNSNKFSCFVISGDYVSPITSPELFSDNVQYVENNKEDYDKPVRYHLIEAAKFDEEGNFVRCPREIDAKWISTIIGFINNDKIKGFVTRAFLTTKRWGTSLKMRFANMFEKREGSIKDVVESTKSTSFDEYVNPDNYPQNTEKPETPLKKHEESELDNQREIVD